MSKRPAFSIAVAFCLGIVIARWLRLPASILAGGFIIVLFAAFVALWQKEKAAALRKPDALLLLACLLAGILRTHLAQTPNRNDISFFADSSAEVLLAGTVDDFPERRKARYRFVLRAENIKNDSIWTATQGRVLVSGDSLSAVGVGDKLLLRGYLRLPDASRNPGAFDYRAYLQAQDITAIFYAGKQAPLWRESARGWWQWRRIVSRTKNWIEAQLASFSEGQRLALLKGLLIGERDEISKEVSEAFARTGLVHILAVSGSNVGFIALIIVTALHLFRLSRRWHAPFLLTGIFFYMILTGAQPPVVRATIMATVIILGELFERDADLYNSLGVAALIILLWQPLQLFQLGFQLSFAAMLGIAYLYEPLLALFKKWLRLNWRPIHLTAMLLAVSFAAQFATLPFSVQAFGRLPLAAIVGNLFVVPVSFIIILASTLACVFSFVEPAAQLFGYVADLTTGGLIDFTRRLAQMPLAYVDSVYISPLLLLFYVIVIVALVEWRRSPEGRRLLLPAGALVLNIFVWQKAFAAGPILRVTFFDVGQGDAALLEFPASRLLVDAGPRLENYDAGERVLIPFLRTHGIRQLDAVVITHPHADHLGGLPALLQEIAIKKVFICGVETNSLLEQRCERLADSLRVPMLTLRAGERLPDFAAAQVGVLHPLRHETGFENINDASVVIKVVFGQHAFLFTGDAEFEGESHLLQSMPILDSDVLKVGHHGSSTSSLPDFLSAVSPRWAVTSVGRWNNFGHPDPQVLARYDSLGIQLLRTDRDGAVVFETDGKTLKRIR
jgi:competence protein ComEC